MDIREQEHFDSISDLMATLHEREKTAYVKKRAKTAASREERGDRWCRQSLSDAMTMADNGGADFDTAQKMMEIKELTDAAMDGQIYMPDWTPAMAGFMPNVPAFCAGEPLTMWAQSEETLKPARVIKIVVVCVPQAGVEADAMLNQGAAILGAIDALERDSNTRVELIGLTPAFSYDHNALMTVKLKAAGDDWNPASVAFAIANPAYGRRIGFKWLESLECYEDLVDNGYGNGRTKKGKSPIDTDIYIPYMTDDRDYDTPQHAVETVTKMFNKQLKKLESEATQ